MLQSQTRSVRCNATGEPPSKGLRIRDYALADAAGNPILLSNFRGKKNLVLIFAKAREAGEAIAEQFRPLGQEFSEEDALAIVIVADEPAWDSGLPHLLIATDLDGVAHKEIGGRNSSGKFVQSCYITDRFGEVYAVLREIPPASEMLRWLDFINSECPECEPPEWPLE